MGGVERWFKVVNGAYGVAANISMLFNTVSMGNNAQLSHAI